jgi:hypothetical protein
MQFSKFHYCGLSLPYAGGSSNHGVELWVFWFAFMIAALTA